MNSEGHILPQETGAGFQLEETGAYYFQCENGPIGKTTPIKYTVVAVVSDDLQ